MDALYYFFKLIFIGTEVFLLFGISPVLNASIIPAIPLMLGMGTLSGKERLLGIFLGFMFSFASSQIILSYMMNFTGITFTTLQKTGILFLVLFGLMMFSPQYALWNRFEDDYRKAKCYGIVFGFIWAFWAAVPNKTFNSELDIISFFIFFFFMVVAASVPSLLFTLIAFVFIETLQ